MKRSQTLTAALLVEHFIWKQSYGYESNLLLICTIKYAKYTHKLIQFNWQWHQIEKLAYKIYAYMCKPQQHCVPVHTVYIANELAQHAVSRTYYTFIRVVSQLAGWSYRSITYATRWAWAMIYLLNRLLGKIVKYSWANLSIRFMYGCGGLFGWAICAGFVHAHGQPTPRHTSWLEKDVCLFSLEFHSIGLAITFSKMVFVVFLHSNGRTKMVMNCNGTGTAHPFRHMCICVLYVHCTYTTNRHMVTSHH